MLKEMRFKKGAFVLLVIYCLLFGGFERVADAEVLTWNVSPEAIIQKDGQLSLSVIGGVAPYTWSVNNGFTLECEAGCGPDNTLFSECSYVKACMATITVTDSEGTSVTGYAKHPGNWVYISNTCELPGPANYFEDTSGQIRIMANHKQRQRYNSIWGCGSSPGGPCTSEQWCGDYAYLSSGEECITFNCKDIWARYSDKEPAGEFPICEWTGDSYGEYCDVFSGYMVDYYEWQCNSECNDSCPDDPDKTEPGECGCGVPDVDEDGDGIVDCNDNCPDIANSDQSDSNGDGVGDACEECSISLTSSTGYDSLSPGERAIITATITPTPSGPSKVKWTVTPANHLDGSYEDITGISIDIAAKATADGWVTITATSSETGCSKSAKLKIGCTACATGICDARGAGFFELSSIDAGFKLGRTEGGKSAGTIFLRAELPSPANSTPQILEATSMGDDTKFLYDTAGVLRQIVAAESFVNIVVTDAYRYAIYFYSPDAMGNLTNGFYEVIPSSEPYVTWTIENPDASPTVYNRLRITENKNGNVNVYEYIYEEAESEWSLIKGDGLQIKSKQEEIIAGERIVTDTIKDDQGIVASKKRTIWHTYPWGDEIIEEIVDPDGAALTTTRSYYDDPDTLGYGRLKTQTNPDGSWVTYQYDTEERKIVEIHSWLDSLDPATSIARVIKYDYAPVDSQDAASPLDERKPRTIAETILGNIVKKTYYAYKINTSNEHIEVVEQCATPSAYYGDASNLRSEHTYYELATGRVEAGKIKRIQYPDGRFDQYNYEYGSYTPNYDPSLPGTFNPGSGSSIRETVTHGTITSPAGIAGKTTRETSVMDNVGNAVLRETWVYDGSGYDRIQWTVQHFDDAGHVTHSYMSDGTRSETIWGCCNKESETDKRGTTVSYTGYDDLGRLLTKVKHGSGAIADLTSSYTYDAAGRQLSQTISSNGLSLSSSSVYDMAGRTDYSIDTAGLLTDYTYSADGSVTTITRPGGATEVTERYLDGQVKRISGTGVIHKHYTYGVNSDGTRWTQVTSGHASSPMWEKTTTDMLGHTIRIEKPGAVGIETIEYVYNDLGQLEKVIPPGQAATLYVYDELGNQIQSGLDVDNDNFLDTSPHDRIGGSESYYTLIGGNWWQETTQHIYATESDDTPTTTAIQRNRLTGLGDGLTRETVSMDINGNQTVSQVFLDRDSRTETRIIDYPDSAINSVSISENGMLVSSQSKTGVTTTFSYDDLGRRTGVTDLRTGTATTHYDEHGRVDYVKDPAGNNVHYTYDALTGEKIMETNDLGNTTRYAYNEKGQLTHTWGNATYPVKYAYDEYGRKAEMHTYRGGSNWNDDTWPTDDTGDVTRWHYDPATGLLSSKEDDKGNRVSYTYIEGGKLHSRTWARTENGNPLVTTYSYDPDTGELINIDYSDSTPDIYFTYDRLGRQKTVTDAVGLRTFAYNDNLQLETETIDGLYTKTITRTYANDGMIGRATGFNLGPEYSITYGYEPATGRFSTLSWNIGDTSDTAVYYYIENSDLLHQLAVDSGQLTTYDYEEHRNVKTQVKNEFDGTLISQYDYEYNSLGQRTSVEYRGSAFMASLGNKLMEAENTNLGLEVPSERRTYKYDNIGNRQNATDWDNAVPEERSLIYTSNSVNQYEQISKDNGVQSVDETLVYDDDGNLIETADRVYRYNAENRLTSVEKSTPVDGDTKVEFVYDYLGRRVKKTVSSYSAASYSVDKEMLFVYDGWNLIAEITSADTRYFVWGLDLSQSLQGAGGVGGLLAKVDSADTKYFCFDGNGNVGQLVDGSDGNVLAHYEYDPYGNVVLESGAEAGENVFRFSTKYFDAEIGLYYYGYRYYSSELGRWINKDPINEKGGLNLYSFVNNNSIKWIDLFGMLRWSEKCSCYLSKKEKAEIEKNLSNFNDIIKKEMVNGWDLDNTKYINEDDILTEDMGKKILKKFENIVVACVGDYNPLSWGIHGVSGLGLPGTNTAYISVKKMKNNYTKDAVMYEISALIFHEAVHLAGKYGHSSPNNPRTWMYIDLIFQIKEGRKELERRKNEISFP